MTEAPKRDRPKPRIKKRVPWGWIVLGAVAVLVAFAAVQAKNAPLRLAVGAPTVFKAGQRNPALTASGYIVARHRATLSAKVPGRLAWLGVEEGSRVQKGQVIARLEAQDFEASRQQVVAQAEQARLDLQRAEALARDGILDRASLDAARSRHRALDAQLRNMDAQLENMVLRAPFTGTVTQKLSEVGETVSPGSAGGANAINAIATLADFDSLEVEVEVNESGILKLKKGMPVEIRVDALNDRPLKGHLREIYPTSNRQKAVVLVRVAFDEKDAHLLPDMGAKVTFLGEPYREDAVVVGRDQVVNVKGQPHVWVLQSGKAALQPVTVVEENPVGLQVTGLAPAAPLLVVPPDVKLAPGRPVAPKDEAGWK